MNINLTKINLTSIIKCTDKEIMIREDEDQPNVSNGAEIENIHFEVFKKLAIEILNIAKYLSKYLSRTCRRRKNPKTANEKFSCAKKLLINLITFKTSINHDICKLLEDKIVKEYMHICQKELMSSQSTFLLQANGMKGKLQIWYILTFN